LNDNIPVGGHVDPSSIVGDNLLWKNTQKNEMKKNTSEMMKRIIPHRSPFVTMFVSNPWYVPSRTITRHHSITNEIRAKHVLVKFQSLALTYKHDSCQIKNNK
jgi:hypothetical protein